MRAPLLRIWLLRLGLVIGGFAPGSAWSAAPSVVSEAADWSNLRGARQSSSRRVPTRLSLGSVAGLFSTAEFATNSAERALLAGRASPPVAARSR